MPCFKHSDEITIHWIINNRISPLHFSSEKTRNWYDYGVIHPQVSRPRLCLRSVCVHWYPKPCPSWCPPCCPCSKPLSLRSFTRATTAPSQTPPPASWRRWTVWEAARSSPLSSGPRLLPGEPSTFVLFWIIIFQVIPVKLLWNSSFSCFYFVWFD